MPTKEEEAKLYLENLSKPTDLIPIEEHSSEEDAQFSKNKTIIRMANSQIVDRLTEGDTSMSIKDIIQAKDVAFRQNRAILGKEDEMDTSKLIPSVINIQVVHNH